MMDDHDDWGDDYLRFEMMNESPARTGGNGIGCGSFFGIVVAICVGIVLLALVLGVEVPGAVIELFLKIIGAVGVIAILSFLFKKR